MTEVKEFSASHIESRREKGAVSAKTLWDDLNDVFEYMNLSLKDACIFAWMAFLHIHDRLEKAEEWCRVPPLFEETNMVSLLEFIYRLGTDLGSVFTMKELSNRGHSPRLCQCDEGTYHYPELTPFTMWADCGNAFYGHVATKMQLVNDGGSLGPELKGDIMEITYNLYFMYAVLNIDVATLLGLEENRLAGWWSQINMIQQDSFIQSAAK